MLKRLLAVAVLSLATPLVTAAQTSDSARIEQELRKIIIEMVEAHARGDRAVFERYLADDYIGTGMNAIRQTKADFLELLPNTSATMKVTLPAPKADATFEMKDVRLHILGETVVMTYQFDYRTNLKRRSNLVSFRVSDVYTKGSEGWQLRVHQATLVPATRRNVDWVFKMAR